MACEVIADGGHQAMKAILENDYFNWTLRTVVGLVLIVAAIDKAANPGAFAVSIANYKLIGEGPALWVATILPWIELVTGLSVLFGVLRTGGAVVASGLFAIFAALMASALARGLDISCGCFSQDPGVGTINGLRIIEDIGLLIASILIARSNNGSFSVEEYIARQASRKEMP